MDSTCHEHALLSHISPSCCCFFYFKTYDQYLISFSDFVILLIKRISTVDILLFGLIGNQNPSGVQSCDQQIRFPLCGRPILLVTNMIADRIRVPSVLLSLSILFAVALNFLD